MIMPVGCATTAPDREIRMTRGYVYFLDGAGGGGLIGNYAGGVRKGLEDAGYDGAGEIFKWQTGLGVVADQTANESYKRGKAAQLANQIAAYRREHPSATVTLMGLSAGTAVAVFVLEALPPTVTVHNVILLSGSLSSVHDLTEALRQVEGKMYVFTSERDAVLRYAVAFSGTADRTSAAGGTIGVEGPRMPRPASTVTREQYKKVVTIPWNPEFARYGDFGGHTDVVKAPFVKAFVAPLVMRTRGTAAPAVGAAAATEAAGRVVNPDYRRWSRFAPGSFVVFDGYQIAEGVQQPLRVKVRLASKSPDFLRVEREPIDTGGEHDDMVLEKNFFVAARIAPEDHPLSHPAASLKQLHPTEIRVGTRTFSCTAQSVSVDAEFPDWGRNLSGTIHYCDDLPGGVARFDLAMEQQGSQVRLVGRAMAYHVAGLGGA